MECTASKLNILETLIGEEILDKFAFVLKIH